MDGRRPLHQTFNGGGYASLSNDHMDHFSMDILDSAGDFHPTVHGQHHQQWNQLHGQAQRGPVQEQDYTAAIARGGGRYDDAAALLGHALEESESPRRVVLYDREDTLDELPSSNAALRWYLEEYEVDTSGGSPKNESEFQCCLEPHPPVIITASTRSIRWRLKASDFDDGLYDIVLGISTTAGQQPIDWIESITFALFKRDIYNDWKIEPSEIITQREFKRMCGANATGAGAGTGGLSRWKLHQQLTRTRDRPLHSVTFELEIRTSAEVPSNAGAIMLHFMDIRRNLYGLNLDDISTRQHRPFLWSLNVNQGHYPEDDKKVKKGKEILHFAISGSGSHAATLSCADRYLLLDLWDIRDPAELSIISGQSGVDPSQHAVQAGPYTPKSCAGIHVPFRKVTKGAIDVSISWDASQVALVDSSAVHLSADERATYRSIFRVFQHFTDRSLTPGTAPPGRGTLVPATTYQHNLQLRNFLGRGKFHISSRKSPNVKKELFIACDGQAVHVFGVHRSWTHRHTILLDLPQEKDLYSSRLFSGLRFRYFAWSNESNEVSVWDVEDGSLVSFFTWPEHLGHRRFEGRTPITFSDDGSILLMCQKGYITTNWTASGTLLNSFMVPDQEYYQFIRDLQFIRGGSQIIVNMSFQDAEYGRGEFGLILDSVNMSVLDRFSIPGDYFAQHSPVVGSGQYLVAAHNSNLDLLRLDDRVVRPFSRSDPKCGRCTDLVRPWTLSSDYTSPAGLQFKAEICQAAVGAGTVRAQGKEDRGLTTIVVTVTDKNGMLSVQKPAIPVRGYDMRQINAVFLDSCSRLVIRSHQFLMIWGLPTTLEGDLTLLLAYKAERIHWRVCRHQQVYAQDYMAEEMVWCMPVERPFSRRNSTRFLDGVITLIDIFQDTTGACRNEVLRYIGRHINSYPNPDDPTESVLAKICIDWRLKLYDSFKEFVIELLASPYGSWAPRNDFDKRSNPLCILLDKTITQPRAIGLAKVIIDYCIRQAKTEKDPHLLSPIMQCLPELIDQERPHQELARRTLQRLAYIPVKSRSFILDHHSIAYQPELRLRPKFWWHPQGRSLHQCKDPVLQLTTIKYTNSINDNFTRSLFVTSFDLLWRKKDGSPVSSSTVWQKLKLNGNAKVECHPFTLQAFDNPAIAALIRYKWNTIGFKYWLVRFLCQCVFYILVLVTVFIQVYSSSHPILTPVYIAIISVASIFIWLELLQLINEKKKYVSSVYNVVDMATFGLPLAGSVNQLLIIWGKSNAGGNPGLISFSVLFIFLHFLFELRVIKSVCHFVTIIIRVVSEIRVFFFIFAGGILGFTIAILHLLRACIHESCPSDDELNALLPEDQTVMFPRNFYSAISSTYFFMGGRYDSINNQLNMDNWPFHTMMTVYFFFTVILMLNVLIALINLAFNESDGTWHLTWLENRLRYIESAENMSYQIPGFRETHDWFPREIYYSATPRQVKDYERDLQVDDPTSTITTTLQTQQQQQSQVVSRSDSTLSQKSTRHLAEENDGEKEEGKKQREILLDRLKKEMREEVRREFQESQAQLEQRLQLQMTRQQELFREQLVEQQRWLVQYFSGGAGGGGGVGGM
ncbi:hypothetical protein BGZ90_009281 [Linnemannia elongata]|nr:hypothetical protein BGZ90_009281 [Linnemannia elongata]